jgi:hypothetical protein
MDDKNNGLTSYLYLILVSLFAAAALRSAIEYLETGNLVFELKDTLFLILCVAFFLALVVFRSLASHLLRCSVCGRFSQDRLIFSDGRSRLFCREHLIERFRQEFTACTEKMVVVYPSLEMKRGPYVYEYRAIDDIREKFLQSPFGRMLTRALSSVGGRCGKCARSGTVAYFGPGNTPWQYVTMRGKGWDDLLNTEIPATFQITCPFCIVDELCFSLGRFEGVFSEGIILPHDGSGILISRLR